MAAHQSLKAPVGTMLAFAIALCCAFLPGAVLADGFPGKGDPADWEDALPYYNLANRYLNLGRYEEAIEKYHQAIARYEFDGDFYTNLGVAYRKIDDYPSAEQSFRKATALNEKDWVPWSDLANACLKQNKLKETIAAFEKTLKCNPPPAEKAAIQTDISDIRKILSMQGVGAPQAATSAQTGSRAVTSARGARKAPDNGAKPGNAPRPALTTGGCSTGHQGSSDANLQGSGWDWVSGD